jgi:2-polyprenyl-3-methyl-5-hydroxy-6-metoxy-1,4-benzoquinol methylase
MVPPLILDPRSSDRKRQEADFHDRREIDRQSLQADEFEGKYANKKWYSIARKSRDFADQWLNAHCAGKTALDYCCGLGGISLQMAEAGAFVHGIDISEESVKTAARRLADNGFADRCAMQVMDAEHLSFADDTFDVIVCSGVLHHLDLDQAYPELARVLKPTGKILCLEAIGHNPFIRLYRKCTPHLRTPWEVDHILKRRDVDKAAANFDSIDLRFFHLCSIAAVPVRNSRWFGPALSLGEAIDNLLLRVPGLRWWAWQMVFELGRPHKGRAGIAREAA